MWVSEFGKIYGMVLRVMSGEEIKYIGRWERTRKFKKEYMDGREINDKFNG